MKRLKKLKNMVNELKTIFFALSAVFCLYIGIMALDYFQGYSSEMIFKTFTFELKTSTMNDFFSLLVFFLLIAAYLYLTSVKKNAEGKK
ncbi:hypothetical protein GKZ89_08585 [Bacillus mangrovi]|uniref:Uncharacterized protein n=1 Tax=Metabacillus mangrovi TaxID=1491830 RepID=A0A7X2V4Y1_9BACI|nr:hypothetical protein [Metabacillus mangrovi]MTH53473.1 hypothetical protein [Metabacillus mangrovi]